MTYLDGSSDGFGELLPDMFKWNPGPSFMIVYLTCMGHPAAPYPSLGSGLSRTVDLGDLLA